MFWAHVHSPYFRFLVASGSTYGSRRRGFCMRPFRFKYYSVANNDIAVTWVLASGIGRELVGMAEWGVEFEKSITKITYQYEGY